MTREEPVYKSVPTFRNYEDYLYEAEYTSGWNDAMDFFFQNLRKQGKKNP